MKNKLVLVVAILVGILAFWMSARYLHKIERELYGNAEEIQVIAAATDLTAGTIIRAEDLGMKSVFKSAVGENIFLAADFQKIKGKRLKVSVKKDSPLMWSQVDMPRDIQSGLSSIITKQKRAISISVSGAPAVSGLIKPNDHVDVLGTFTFPSRTNPAQVESVTLTLMQNVTVLATGAMIAGQNMQQTRGSGGYSSVTFEVTPEEAELLVFAQQTRGQLYLTLRNPEDVHSKDFMPSVNFDYLESELQKINEARQSDIRRNAR